MRRKGVHMNNRLYLDIHALQILPPSCVNRDDTNTPKTCIYGGKIRSRVSSQCWKRATRKYLEKNALEDIGVRTRRFKSLVVSELIAKYDFTEDEAANAVANGIKASGIASGKEDGKEDAKEFVAFFSNAEITAFAKVLADDKADALNAEQCKKLLKDDLIKAIKETPSSDILLFGRMFAKKGDLNYDAACQVAHAISVNETRMEYDYFTAVDDLPAEGDAGSAYLDTKQFTDPILYRYANVNLSETSELIRMDKTNAARIARNFTEAFLLSMPTGSMNAYANATLPEYIMITLRDDMPVSFAPAFIKPVFGKDYEEEAEQKLTEYADKISSRYGAPAIVLSLKEHSLREILDMVEKSIAERI